MLGNVARSTLLHLIPNHWPSFPQKWPWIEQDQRNSSTSSAPSHSHPTPTPPLSVGSPSSRGCPTFLSWRRERKLKISSHLGLAMALPSRSYSARSSPLLPSVGGRHTCMHIHHHALKLAAASAITTRTDIDSHHQVLDPFAN